MGVSVIIGGDVYPGESHSNFFEQGDATAIFGDVLSEFQTADCSVVNLECALFDGNAPIIKNGPALKASTKSINALINAQITAVNLANNHILDHGEEGLRSTMDVCEKSGIMTFGAGPDLQSARKIQVLSVQNIRIGFLGLAEHEFSIATEESWGASPLDLIDYVRNVRISRPDFDYLVVLLHGGSEHYPFPSPRIMKICRFLIEEGANIVVCQHSHCAGCYEEYHGGHIVYGQGNLLFDEPNQGKMFYEGFLVKLEIEQDGRSSFSLIPFEQCRTGFGVKKFSERDEKEFVSTITQRSEAILEINFVKERWDDFCNNQSHYYLSKLLGHSRPLKRLNRNGLLTRMLYSKSSLLTVKNVVTCESHREVLETILTKKWLFT